MWDSKRNDIDVPGFYFPEYLFFAESNVKQWGGEIIPLYRHAQQPVAQPAPECQHQWKFGGANKLQSQKQCIKCGHVELDAQQPIVPDERAAFNAWNNDVDCPLAGRDAKSAAWMAWQARAELAGNSPVIPDTWIPVRERMPEDGQHIIIFCDDAFVLSAQYRDGEFFDVVRDGDEFFETTSRCVTHWMPLPAAPQEVR
ncbi:TPA: DUF551 domain-containing protein [Klebsiella oxytoca]|nr:DUF551 domain-containing protein [Klebsiella oxytoca]